MQDFEPQLRAWMMAGLAGDAAAYRALLADLRARLLPFFIRRPGDHAAEADDLVQDALIAIHTRRDTYDAAQPFTAWAYAIARYKLVDHYRRARRRATLPLEHADALFGPDESAAADARRDVSTALAGLPPRTQALIRDTKLDGLSTADAAARAGMSETAAKVAVHRGLRKLTARFAPSERSTSAIRNDGSGRGVDEP